MSVLLSVMCMTYFVHSRVSNTEITYKKYAYILDPLSVIQTLFILQQLRNKLYIHVITYINRAHWHWCLRWCGVCVRELEHPEKTHLPNLVTTWPFHMWCLGIGPGTKLWEASTLPLCQSDNLVHYSIENFLCNMFSIYMYIHKRFIATQPKSILYLNYSVFPPIEDLSYGPYYSVKYDCPYYNFSL